MRRRRGADRVLEPWPDPGPCRSAGAIRTARSTTFW